MNKEEREKLMDQVTDMRLIGYTHQKIANQLKINRRTVIRYIAARRDDTIKEMRASAEEQVAALEQAKNKRLKKIWEMVLDPKSTKKDVGRAIKLLQQEEVLEVKRKQLIGLLPAEAPMIAIQNNNTIESVTTIADSIRRNYPELIEKFRHNKARLINVKEDTQSNTKELDKPASEDKS